MLSAFQQLSEETKDFWAPLSEIPRLNGRNIDPLFFYKEFVNKSVPVIISNAISHWPALEKWGCQNYLRSQAGEATVSVDITPNGYGDSVTDLSLYPIENPQLNTTNPSFGFIKPEERTMTFNEFLNALYDEEFDGIPYLSHQNDSLREEFPLLCDDVDPFLDFAVQSFGNKPEAVNLWIGDERAISSIHKDHYENMYCVITGQKHFVLLPPSDIAFLHETEYNCGRFKYNEGSVSSAWSVELEPGAMVPWIPIDPRRNYEKDPDFPLAQYISPIECVVEPGEVLYLPAMWYHRATQTCPTISVNYWHDMEFDCRYVYYNFVRNVAENFSNLHVK